MASHHSHTLDPSEQIRLGPASRTLAIAGLVIGLICLGVAFGLGMAAGDDGIHRTYIAYLTNFAFFLSISLGALFFVAIQHLVKAGWSVTVRRIAEILAANVLVLFVLLLPIIVGLERIYLWTRPEEASAFVQHAIEFKSSWLNEGFFVFRLIAYFTIWTLLSRYFLTKSVEQDRNGDPDLTLKMQGLAPGAIVLFALTITLVAFDLFMSLDPSWFSTMFGVYYFTGGMMATFAVLILISMFLQRRGLLKSAIHTEHYHDMGKFLFGFMVFWMYIAYSQYMLIWYAGLPEETLWMINRGLSTANTDEYGGYVATILNNANPWTYLALFILIGHFFLPFFGLMSRHVKRHRLALGCWAAWLLGMHYLDMVWVVMPTLTDHLNGSIGVGVPGIVALILTFVGIGGIYLAGAIRFASGNALLPVKDPRLNEALGFHQPI